MSGDLGPRTPVVTPMVPNPRTWKTHLHRFDTYLRAAGRSPGTIRLYRYRIADLADLAKTPAEVTTELLLRILSTPGWQPETRKSVRTSYRTYFAWAVRTGLLEHDPALLLPAVSVPQAEPRPTPDLVVRRSLRAADDRERLMVLLGAYAGLRCCEIARVHGEAWDGRRLRVTGKGGKVRTVPIAQQDLVDELDALQGWAFPNRWTGEPITPGHVSRLLSSALEQTWTGHTLRHRFGTTALEGTKDLLAVGQVMGHSRPETTQRYCRVSADRLDAVAAAAAA